jgi:hypothetical protein
MIKFHPYYILTGEGKVDKEGKKRAAHIFALLKNTSATPTLLLLKKRSGTPPSLPILGVALKRVPLFNTLLFTIIFRPKMIKFHPYYILTGEGKVDFLIYCMLIVKWDHRKIDNCFYKETYE